MTREVTVPKRPRDADRHDQHADHLYEYGDAIADIVGVVRGGEPAEVHPRPPDREEHERVADEHRLGPPAGQTSLQATARFCDRHDEGEIEEQFERR